MKILHIGQMVGGISLYIRNTTAALAQQQLEFVIISGRMDQHKPLTVGGETITEHKIDLYREPSLKDLKGLWQAIKVIRKERPDVIHCHSAKGGFIGRIAGFICGVATLYTPHAYSFLSTKNSLKRKIYLLLERLARLNSYMLACSKSEQQLGEQSVGYRATKSLCWSNSVPNNNAEIATSLSDEVFKICYIGRPCYQKNVQFLVEVARQVVESTPNVKFYLLGIGYYSPELEAVRSLIEHYSLQSRFELVEWLPQQEIFEYVKASDIYLSTSLYEGLPLSVIEAMSMGRAIVASDVLGNVDCVVDGENGYLLPLDVERFASKIVELYNNRELRQKMGSRSRELFEEQFCIDTQIDKLRRIYIDVVNKKL